MLEGSITSPIKEDYRSKVASISNASLWKIVFMICMQFLLILVYYWMTVAPVEGKGLKFNSLQSVHDFNKVFPVFLALFFGVSLERSTSLSNLCDSLKDKTVYKEEYRAIRTCNIAWTGNIMITISLSLFLLCGEIFNVDLSFNETAFYFLAMLFVGTTSFMNPQETINKRIKGN